MPSSAVARLALSAGLLLYLLCWWMPLNRFGAGDFSAHMFRHMVLVAVAPVFLVIGWPAIRRLWPFSPLLAALVELVLVWAWHLPRAHVSAQSSMVPFLFEQLSFVIAGLVLWVSVLAHGNALSGAGGLLLTSMHMTLLGALLTLSPTVLFQAFDCAPDAWSDQQSGGVIMLLMGTPVYLVGALNLLWGVLQSGEGERAQHEAIR